MVTKSDIITGLKDIGLGTGDSVVVHSSLSSFGEVEGGADTVVDAILEVIGKQGTLVVPTFNPSPGIFDPDTTPSTCGAVAEGVRRRPDAIRSHHPTHSVAAIGRLADILTEGHQSAHAFGRGSALFNLLQANGKVLMLGVDMTSNSMVYVAEEIARVPYLDRSLSAEIRNPLGKVFQKWVRRPGCSDGFDSLEESLQENNVVSEAMIGQCRARLMTARNLIKAAVDLLQFDKEALLCDRPDCADCAEARAMIGAVEAEAQDQEIIELAEQEGRTLKLIESQFQKGKIDFYTADNDKPSPN